MKRSFHLHSIYVVLWLLAALALSAFAAGAIQWTPAAYPNPMIDTDKCGRNGLTSWICDPDGVISFSQANVIEGIIKEIHAGQSPYVRHKCGAAGLQGYQVAVALMKEFMLESGRTSDQEAKYFAKALHDKWGVGEAACNNGIVLLLSVANRRVYISTGVGAAKHLHNSVLDIIIGNMKPLLKEGRYGKAVEQAVVEAGLALAGHRPKDRSQAGTGIIFVVFAAFAGIVGWSAWTGYKQRKRYQACRDKLEKIKRDQAAARSGQQFVSSSCPICLEDFTSPSSSASSSPGSSSPSSSGLRDRRKGSAPRLGEEEAEQLLGNSQDAAAASSSTATAPGAGGSSTQRGGRGRGAAVERKPLYLRCGHAFCEPCIGEWVKKHSTCPICRKDMTQDDDQPPSTANPSGPLPSTQTSSSYYYSRTRTPPHMHYHNVEPELLFRLGSLRRMYPWYVSTDMYDTWSSDIRQQRELNTERLRAFQMNDPAIRQQHEESGSRGTSNHWGGGSSGGGGGSGGSW